MIKQELLQKNLRAKKDMPLSNPNDIITFKNGERFLGVIVRSPQCIFAKHGFCTCCVTHGHSDRPLTVEELTNALEKYVTPQLDDKVETVLFGSYGSIFDISEVPIENFYVILKYIREHKISSVVFETHYATVTVPDLNNIRKILPNTNVRIEMGFESCDQDMLDNCLGKCMHLDDLVDVIGMIHTYDNMTVTLNVMLGGPNMDDDLIRVEQANKSVIWAFEHGADQVVIFPYTIKPYTYGYELFKENRVNVMSIWALVELLNKIPERYITRVSLSKFDPRLERYEMGGLLSVPPMDCPFCREAVQKSLMDFIASNDALERKRIIQTLRDNYISIHQHGCGCMRILNSTRDGKGWSFVYVVDRDKQ